jgi:hypothetical protein
VTAAPSAAATPAEAGITQSTPAPTGQLSTARLLGKAVVSDLVQEQSVPSAKAHRDPSDYVVHQLSLFDPLDSPEALEVFANLSGYYLGFRGGELYDCLSLRKGKLLKPYLEQSLNSTNVKCSQELGATKPSYAPSAYALCVTDRQQKTHLTALIAKIDSGKKCSDSELAALAASTQPSSTNGR